MHTEKALIAVPQSSLFSSCRALFSALETFYPIRFSSDEGVVPREADAVLLEKGRGPLALGHPPLPTLEFMAPTGRGARSGEARLGVCFEDAAGVPRGFARRSVVHAPSQPPVLLESVSDQEVLATINGAPIWVCGGRPGPKHYRMGLALSEAVGAGPLREAFRLGSFAPVLALLTFLADVLTKLEWSIPRARACIIADDPNLFATRYGHLDYAGLLAHQETPFHLSVATIPLDSWFAAGRVVRLFHSCSGRLSLIMHGNNHTHCELDNGGSEEQYRASLGQALRRIERLEARTGLSVARVTVAPHDACSLNAIQAMEALGYEGLCIDRPRPWAHANSTGTLLGWGPAEMVGAFFPVLPRYGIAEPLEELLFRRLLGQPLILSAHHQDFASTKGLVQAAIEFVNSLGDVEWCSVSSIARSNFLSYRMGPVLVVKPFARTLEIPVAQEVSRIKLDLPAGVVLRAEVFEPGTRLYSGLIDRDALIPVPRPSRLVLRLSAGSESRRAGLPKQRTHLWPFLRRAMTYSRDQVHPWLS